MTNSLNTSVIYLRNKNETSQCGVAVTNSGWIAQKRIYMGPT